MTFIFSRINDNSVGQYGNIYLRFSGKILKIQRISNKVPAHLNAFLCILYIEFLFHKITAKIQDYIMPVSVGFLIPIARNFS